MDSGDGHEELCVPVFCGVSCDVCGEVMYVVIQVVNES